jgi:hypothetical protein
MSVSPSSDSTRVSCTPLTPSASRSKSPSPTKKVTPEIVVEKAEASVNVEDVPSSGGGEDEKPDTSDVGESSFLFLDI